MTSTLKRGCSTRCNAVVCRAPNFNARTRDHAHELDHHLHRPAPQRLRACAARMNGRPAFRLRVGVGRHAEQPCRTVRLHPGPVRWSSFGVCHAALAPILIWKGLRHQGIPGIFIELVLAGFNAESAQDVSAKLLDDISGVMVPKTMRFSSMGKTPEDRKSVV